MRVSPWRTGLSTTLAPLESVATRSGLRILSSAMATSRPATEAALPNASSAVTRRVTDSSVSASTASGRPSNPA